MKHRTFAVVFVVGAVVMGSLGQEAGSKEASLRSQGQPKAITTESSLKPILEVLSKAKLSGSLELSGNCNNLAFPGYPEFPQVATPATIDGSPLRGLRKLFADDPAMRVTQDPDGTLRMVERGVQKDILHIRIRHISFDGGAYDPNVAAEYIVTTPEVELFMKSQDIHWPFGGYVAAGTGRGIVGEIPPTASHISGSMENVTLSGAMDHVLKTFPGLWIYENCPSSDTRKRIIYFEFYELQGKPNTVIIPIPSP